MADLDLAREHAPDPAWLRQLASTLKLEAAVLEGHADALAGVPVLRLQRAWSPMVMASQSLGTASRQLPRLADVLDEVAVAS